MSRYFDGQYNEELDLFCAKSINDKGAEKVLRDTDLLVGYPVTEYQIQGH